MTFSFASGFKRPWSSPSFRRETLPFAVAYVPQPPILPRSSPILNQRANNEGLPSLFNLRMDKAISPFALFRSQPSRLNWLPTGRHFVNDRQIQIAV